MGAPEKFAYRIQEVEVQEFSLVQAESGKIDIKKVLYNVVVEVKLNKEFGLIGMFVSVTIFDNREKMNQLANIKTLVGFEVKDFNEVVGFDENDIPTIPIKLEAATRRIAISTTRGIMFSHLNGTYLKNAILPIVPEMMTPQKIDKGENKK